MYTERRPRLKIKLKSIDIAFEWIGIIGLLLLIGLPVYFYSKLPEIIPSHFAINGEPDKFSEKEVIWILPTIGIVLYLGLLWLNKFPHIFNYPQKVTSENAKRLYTISTRMIRVLNAVMSCTFAYISYSTIQISLGNQFELGSWFIPIFMILMLGPMAFSLYKSFGKK